MKVMTRPTVAALLLLIVLISTTVAQQKRQAPAKPQPKPAAAPAPAPTFDTLVPAEKYTLYGEVRGVGQLIKSSALTDALEPILKLAGPPKEFKTLVKWLNAHADEVMTSRLLVATWAVDKTLPETIIAVEFASAEEATKFAAPLNTVLATVLPPVAQPTPESQAENAKSENSKPEPPKPSYYLKQSGSLILLTQAPLTLKKLKPAGSKPLSEDVNFRSARNRFNSESIFVFIDVKLMERQEEQTRKQLEAQRQVAEEQKKAAEEELKKQEESKPADDKEEERQGPVAEKQTELVTLVESTKELPTPDPVMTAVSMLGSSFFSGPSKWPDAVAVALDLENESFDLRALLVNQPGEKSDTVPFMPMLIPGPPIVPEAPNIFPADTELLVTMSLDLPQIYSTLSKARPANMIYPSAATPQPANEVAFASPLITIEEKLKISLKDDLLPLLGSEVALRIPVTGLDVVGLPKGPAPEPVSKDNKPPVGASPVLLISLRDKEGVRTLMPKIVDALGFKGASSLAQTERKEDTEIVSYLNVFSYAFIGNFLVLSADSASVRHVVDSYLKHETLAGESNYKSFTRWQPRPAHGQLYISPALMESYKIWVERTTQVSDQAKAILTRLTTVAQPITYSLSNEGLGPLHEVHIPRNLLLMAVVGISGEVNAPPDRQSERMVMGTMHMIAFTQEQYKKGKGAGSYGTLEQLTGEGVFTKDLLDQSGYKFEMVVTGDKFEVFAVPAEYGKSGKMSYFIDQTRVLRGADRSGAAATSADPPIN